jgi:hypothetical protein
VRALNRVPFERLSLVIYSLHLAGDPLVVVFPPLPQLLAQTFASLCHVALLSPVRVGPWPSKPAPVLCTLISKLLLHDLVQSCAREGEEDSGGHVLWDTTSRGLGGLV